MTYPITLMKDGYIAHANTEKGYKILKEEGWEEVSTLMGKIIKLID